ncbi:MAG: MlaE family lipid ABC transporter permease subunit [Gammaproteobacteria bacterium]|nr:MlaE family lipid ABC transporter permease subunit [Gammaproteobacteria bacterium]MBU1733554.1 MlaE family lipid ABC transporter permease subunit [Gammaproteobacteria bacterium]MBU1891730.1 MlaE family lipid ABC transporter permease subunit [Gammaproteobacteria bacterium]
MTKRTSQGEIKIDETEDVIRCHGAWILSYADHLRQRVDALTWPENKELVLDCNQLDAMDTAGAWLLYRLQREVERAGCRLTVQGLQPAFTALLGIIATRAEDAEAVLPVRYGVLERLGRRFAGHMEQAAMMLAFIGEAAMSALRLIKQPSRIRIRPLLHNIQSAGFEALPIVGLLSFLMGVVVSYQGAEQLARYGASIFVADLVGLSMLREMSPLLTAIIVAGRSGSAFTAQIGTMKVTEEIDAMRTIGIAPMDFLVLPKILALLIAVPLLTVYADIMGIVGGMVMAKTQLGIHYADFMDRLEDAVRLSSYLVGLGKALVFAVIVGVVGCFQGFQVGGSADSVGRQTTISVVQAIFLVIVMDAVFSVIFSWLKI